MGSTENSSVRPGWQKRLTYVTTSRQVTTGRGTSVGTIIGAERLVGMKVGCPRCDAPAATIWRRFDYFGRELPLYFTKCRRCHRRSSIDADEAAFRLLEAGVVDAWKVVHEGIPVAGQGEETDHHGDSAATAGDVTAAEGLVANRQRAYGKNHPLTFAARAQYADAVGKSGDAPRAARIFEQLLVDQQTAVGPQSSSVLAHRYRAAVWTTRSGHPSQALTALRGLVADQESTLGSDHPNTLITRATIAQLVDETGDRDEAIGQLRQVNRDQLRVLGSEHPATEATRQVLAEWEGR